MRKSDCYARMWTDEARDCYQRGCVCRGCYMQEILGDRCRMKTAVFKLVKELGAPHPREKWLNKEQQAVIYAILAGDTTRDEIKARTGLTHRTLQYVLTELYRVAETDNFIPNYKRDSLPKFVKWVKGEGYYD